MRFDNPTRKNDIFGPGKPGKNKNMTRKTWRKIEKKIATDPGRQALIKPQWWIHWSAGVAETRAAAERRRAG